MIVPKDPMCNRTYSIERKDAPAKWRKIIFQEGVAKDSSTSLQGIFIIRSQEEKGVAANLPYNTHLNKAHFVLSGRKYQ